MRVWKEDLKRERPFFKSQAFFHFFLIWFELRAKKKQPELKSLHLCAFRSMRFKFQSQIWIEFESKQTEANRWQTNARFSCIRHAICASLPLCRRTWLLFCLGFLFLFVFVWDYSASKGVWFELFCGTWNKFDFDLFAKQTRHLKNEKS